jgi:hypothetical protein
MMQTRNLILELMQTIVPFYLDRILSSALKVCQHCQYGLVSLIFQKRLFLGVIFMFVLHVVVNLVAVYILRFVQRVMVFVQVLLVIFVMNIFVTVVLVNVLYVPAIILHSNQPRLFHHNDARLLHHHYLWLLHVAVSVLGVTIFIDVCAAVYRVHVSRHLANNAAYQNVIALLAPATGYNHLSTR